MTYVQSNDQLLASYWSDMFADANARMDTAFQGMSPVLARAITPFQRIFFIGFEPQDVGTHVADFHPLAYILLWAWALNPPPLNWRAYNQSTIDAATAALTVNSFGGAPWNVVRLNKPDWLDWVADVYPAGFGGRSTDTIAPSGYAPDNILDISLKVMKRSGVHITFADAPHAEHEQPLKPIDLFALGDFSFDSSWDKYSLVRVHNVGVTPLNASFGSGLSIPAGSCYCFRKIEGSWTHSGKYFFDMHSGDGRFQNIYENTNSLDPLTGFPTAAVTSGSSTLVPGTIYDTLWASQYQPYIYGTGSDANKIDYRNFYDMSSVYNNSGYTKQNTNEIVPPYGGYFPTPSDSTPIGDLIVNRGKLLVANRGPQSTTGHMRVKMILDPLNPIVTTYLTDSDNVVANVNPASVVVYNVTTGQTLPADSSGLGDYNWFLYGGNLQIGLIPRGSYYDSGSWYPIVPSPPAPFISAFDEIEITFTYIPPDDHVFVEFDGFASLPSKLTNAGLLTRTVTHNYFDYGTINNTEIYSTGTPKHLIDIGAPLITTCFGGTNPNPAKIIGAGLSLNPTSIEYPLIKMFAPDITLTHTTTNTYYYPWHMSGASPVVDVGSPVNLSYFRDSSSPFVDGKYFTMNTTLGDLKSYITTQTQTNGVVSVRGFHVKSTPFGHILHWEEVWPLDKTYIEYVNHPAYAVHVDSVELQGLTIVVARSMPFNMHRAQPAGGDGNSEFGVFPSIGSGSSYFMPWNFPRTLRAFEHPRWFFVAPSQQPWLDYYTTIIPPGRYYNSRIIGPFASADSSLDGEWNNLYAFYENGYINVDTVASPVVKTKYNLSRPGRCLLAPDIWTPFSYWLAKIPALTYPNGASNASIGTGSGWYAANVNSVMANSNISNPLYNVVPCEFEQFNALGSLMNGITPDVVSMPQVLNNVSYKFDVSSIFLVDAGTKYQVNDLVEVGNFVQIKVTGVTGTGGITTFVVMIDHDYPYDILNTHRNTFRPFASTSLTSHPGFPSATIGTGATFDFAAAETTQPFNFIPTYNNVIVPRVPTPGNANGLDLGADGDYRANGSFWPKNSFFSWYGASTGGVDLVADHFTSLGMTVHTTLPDNYGQPLPIYEYDLHVDMSISSDRISSYAYGCTAAFQTKCNTYRYVSFDDVRSYYNELTIPFVVNLIQLPFAWKVFNVTGDVSVSSADIPRHVLQDSQFGTTGSPTPPLPTLPTDSGGGPLGSVNHIQADWFSDVEGNWVTTYSNQNLSNVDAPCGGPRRFWTKPESCSGGPVARSGAPFFSLGGAFFSPTRDTDYFLRGFPIVLHGYSWDGWNFIVNPDNPDIGTWKLYKDYTASAVCYSISYALPTGYTHSYDFPFNSTWPLHGAASSGFPVFDDTDYSVIVGDVPLWINNPQRLSGLGQNFAWNPTALMVRLENAPSRIIACLPQNIAYRDETYVSTIPAAYISMSSNPYVIPVITNNTVEASQAEVTYAPGTTYTETMITTELVNARVSITRASNSGAPITPAPPGGGI